MGKLVLRINKEVLPSNQSVGLELNAISVEEAKSTARFLPLGNGQNYSYGEIPFRYNPIYQATLDWHYTTRGTYLDIYSNRGSKKLKDNYNLTGLYGTKIHLLQFSRWAKYNSGTKLAMLKVYYKDGSFEAKNLVLGQNTADWSRDGSNLYKEVEAAYSWLTMLGSEEDYSGHSYYETIDLNPTKELDKMELTLDPLIEALCEDIDNDIGIYVKAMTLENDQLPMNGSISINNKALFSNSIDVQLDISFSGNTQGMEMMISNYEDFSEGQWEPYSATKAWTLISGDGVKKVYLKFRDSRGNESISPYPEAIITLDRTGPSGSVKINNGEEFTQDVDVILNLSATDELSGVSHMMISNNSNFIGSEWEQYSPIRMWKLTTGDGLKRVYVKYRDNAGNISLPYEERVTVDTKKYLNVSTPFSGGNNVEVKLANGVEIIFQQVTDGEISVEARPPEEGVPSGFRLIGGSYYEINTTATYLGAVKITLPYIPENVIGEENNLKLFHWKDNSWKDITISVDRVNKKITGLTTSFSPFVVVENEGEGGSDPIARSNPDVGGLSGLPEVFIKNYQGK